MKKRALGKGLKAFIPEEYGILKEERYSELDIDELRSNPFQPRLKFAQESIDELARSIRESGVLQPILVTPEGDHFKIIVGERRWLAAQKIGLKKIPAIIRSMTKEKQLEASLIENLQREDLNPLEVALAYQKLIQELHYTQQDVAEKVGKDRTSVTNYLRLLKLPKEIQQNLAENKFSMGHARALISIEDPNLQTSLSRKIIEKDLSVRDVEKMISKFRHKSSPEKTREPDPDLMALQEELLKLLGTKVSISGNQKKGIIRIYYFSMDGLNSIYDRIKGAG